VYDLPDERPPILVSGFGPKAIDLAAQIGDGFCTTSPDKEAIDRYRSAGGKGPVHAGTKVCFMDEADRALQATTEPPADPATRDALLRAFRDLRGPG
jgi:alkanesulfonate monooxygenase SsuD/methylene tetrahydromethanopterin reductase-like flavin-dependent oxidoreductase (luciferase family)